jgi:hypothetical protein
MQWNGKKEPVPVLPACIVGAPSWMRLNSREWAGTGGMVERVSITDSGTSVTRDGGTLQVPRPVLGAPLMRIFAEQQIHVSPEIDLAAALVDELRSFDPHRLPALWHAGPTDVLALSLALALWWDEEKHRHEAKVSKLVMG